MSDIQFPTPMIHSVETTNYEEAYAQWRNNHSRIKSAPPTKGRDYIKHAADLLTLLEPFAAVNPIAQGVVTAFKVVVSLEQERRENDARMDAVILAQADLMHVLLDVDQLTRLHTESHKLYTISSIEDIFDHIKMQIKMCHNCMDTYKKQRMIPRLLKANDWKETFMGFVSTFSDLRQRLLTVLNLQTAFNVSQMVTDMNKILTRLFSTQNLNLEEKQCMKEINTVGRESLTEGDLSALKKLVASTGDSAIGKNTPGTFDDVKSGEKRGSSKPDPQKVRSVNIDMYIDELREDIRASVDTLCKKNMKHFETTLAFHTDHLKKSIRDSADRVIGSLSGPHDRLQHADLRQLWKEMKWIFCVETRVFALALFEYYQDLYAYPHIVATDTSEDTENSDIPTLSSRSKVHPDAWTLPYLGIFTTATATIDDDNSGFIRISEANKFTSRIPEGWTLPQYCAYLVEGRHHENSIYRHRIICLRCRVHDMHAQLLPGNRYAATYVMVAVCDSIIDKLALHPRSGNGTLSIAPKLHELVKKKILEQDQGVREGLKKFEYDLDKTSAGILFRGQYLEQYIFPLACALMELVLDFHHFCCSSTVDYRQWTASITKPFSLLRLMIDERIKELKGNERTSDLAVYHRGIWLWFEQPDFYDLEEAQQDEFFKCMFQDVIHHQGDTSFIEDFPLPAFRGDLATQTYPTWEEFLERGDISTVPEDYFAYEWGPGIDDCRSIQKRLGFFNLPTSRFCDGCSSKPPIAFYRCLVCDDFDLCHDCYDKHPSEHNVKQHNFGHHVALVATYLQQGRHVWIICQGEREAEECHTRIQEIRALNHSLKPDNHNDDLSGDILGNSDEGGLYGATEDPASKICTAEQRADIVAANLQKPMLYECFVCQARITLESRFFICVEYSCREGCRICHKCALQQHDNVNTHFWWHSLLSIDERMPVRQDSDPSSTNESPTAMPEQAILTHDSEQNGPLRSDLASVYGSQPDQLLENAISLRAAVEQRISALESKIDERLSGIEAMLKRILGLGVGGALLIENPTSPPVQQVRPGLGGSQDRQYERDAYNREQDKDDTGYGQGDTGGQGDDAYGVEEGGVGMYPDSYGLLASPDSNELSSPEDGRSQE